jgi:sterol desaturase/sphingolipid hydroxylase (fatty acid hydroxylase superfamily)
MCRNAIPTAHHQNPPPPLDVIMCNEPVRGISGRSQRDQFAMSFFASHQHLLQFLTNVVRLCLTLAFVTALFAPLEHFFAIRRDRFFYQGWATDLGWFFLNGLLLGFLLGPPSALIAWAVHALLPQAITGAAATLPLWARIVGAMVIGEVGFYWGHRWSHEIPLLWRFHAVHHSAEHIGYLVNTRGHPVDVIFTRLCGLILLYATGFASPVGAHPALIPAIMLFVSAFWSYFIHANVRVRLGVLEEIISTPAFHHWHHTREDHKDHNYSAMVPVMDRIFGTFYLPKSWPAEYGTNTPIPANLVEQLLQPLAPDRDLAAAQQVSRRDG